MPLLVYHVMVIKLHVMWLTTKSGSWYYLCAHTYTCRKIFLFSEIVQLCRSANYLLSTATCMGLLQRTIHVCDCLWENPSSLTNLHIMLTPILITSLSNRLRVR